MGNFTVRASVEVKADSPEQAMDKVADAIRAGMKGSGIAPGLRASRPLDVRWLCPRCHRLHHAEVAA